MATIKWQKWKEDLLDQAETANKPLLLWIDYRGCQTCARMEAESFADPVITERVMQEVVPVRVDRDEYPDIDRHFQRVFEVHTGKEGGWPLTLFVAQDGTPLHVDAYLPPRMQEGKMGFSEVLDLVVRNWREDREGFIAKGRASLERLALPTRIEATRIDPEALVSTLRSQIEEVYDPEHGGYGDAPKHLHVSLMKMLPVLLAQREDESLKAGYHHTLKQMMERRIWDRVRGGFFCCSGDAAWQEPVGRKSLAENAIMAIACLRAAEMTGMETCRGHAYKIADWALERMKDPATGLFHAGEIDGVADERILFAPNALMAAALLSAAGSEDRFRADALGTLHQLMERMVRGEQIVHQDGSGNATTYLADYATLGAALLMAYDLTGNDHFVDSAGEFASEALRRFYDRGRWSVGDGRWRDPTVFVDTSLSSPAATMVMVLNRLSKLLDKAYFPFVEQTLAVASYELMRRPIAKAAMAEAALRVYGGTNEEIGMRK